MWTGPLLAGGLADVAGIRGAILLLLMLAVPITISLHVSKSVRILPAATRPGTASATSLTPSPDDTVGSAGRPAAAAP